jgi:hypothetical protein
VRKQDENEKRVGIRPSQTPHPLEVNGPGQAEIAVHRVTCTRKDLSFRMRKTGLLEARQPKVEQI